MEKAGGIAFNPQVAAVVNALVQAGGQAVENAVVVRVNNALGAVGRGVTRTLTEAFTGEPGTIRVDQGPRKKRKKSQKKRGKKRKRPQSRAVKRRKIKKSVTVRKYTYLGRGRRLRTYRRSAFYRNRRYRRFRG